MSAAGSVSEVSTSVLSNGDSPATVVSHEQVTFQPAGNKPITFLSDGAEQSLIGTDERCNEITTRSWCSIIRVILPMLAFPTVDAHNSRLA